MAATDRLYARLPAGTASLVRSMLPPEEAKLWDEAAPDECRRLTLAYGVHHGVPAVLQNTGLSAAVPPEDVHAMSRGSLAAGGSYYYADLMVGASSLGGLELRPGMRALDFGCSSGRVVRVLQAAYPEVEWHGCDPLAASIEWAQTGLPDIEFTVSPHAPPTNYQPATFDFVFAVSIWSHFAESAAKNWLREMERIVKPDGILVLTSHGWDSVAYARGNDQRGEAGSEAISRSLCERSFWYRPEFRSRADHGLINPEWGTAFFTAEWLLDETRAGWDVAALFPGIVESNQDLYVLRRGATISSQSKL
jgi:SAM-dependent methyltransferase